MIEFQLSTKCVPTKEWLTHSKSIKKCQNYQTPSFLWKQGRSYLLNILLAT